MVVMITCRAWIELNAVTAMIIVLSKKNKKEEERKK